MPIFLVTHRWQWAGTGEIGLHTQAVDSTETDPAVVADAFGGFLTTFAGSFSATLSPFTSQIEYTRVSAAEVLDLALGTLAAASHRAVTLQSTNTSRIVPQAATAVSLIGGLRPNGTPIRGRFYLPPVGSNRLTAEGYIEPVDQQEIATAIGAWFTDAMTSGVYQLGVWSRVLANFTDLTEASVGRVVDTIRTRRAQLQEENLAAWP